MGLKFEDLIDLVRTFMVEEIDMDSQSDKIYRSSYLTQRGQGKVGRVHLAEALSYRALTDEVRRAA